MISKEDVSHIAKLARLELTEDEKELFSQQLSSVLSYIEQLKEVDTTGIEYHYHVEGLENVMDEDEVTPADEDTRAALLDAMPDRAGDFLKVKGVFN
ncbi:Asp-tRNA(Asn)/Glu-tRNA(Gln) amidotransferase subunit GatC [Candidatus Uhrbacteria bacterium]|nr:Asp-tRNA(Asn)/Glu-tRNA(Gln) amidotransferase subunit GatC [Candidatus Uhrbacteria bacterium]